MNEPGENRDVEKENRLIRDAALCAFLLNLLLAAVKGWLAYRSSSLAVTAGAIDSASDSAASLAVFGGLVLSTRKTRAFPLGLYKIENLASVVVALFIFFAGYEIVTRIVSPPSAPPDITLPLLYWMLGCTVAVFAFGQYALRLGKKTGSPALAAEGRHRQVDVLSSLAVMVSVLLNYLGIDFQYHYLTIDRIAALLVLIFIVKAGWELLSDGMRVLLDASVDHATLDAAREVIYNEPAVRKVESIAGRSAGRFRFLRADIALKTGDLKKARQISRRIEENIKKRIPHVERVILNCAPSESRILRIAFPVLDDGDTVCEHFGAAPYFSIWRIRREDGETEMKTLIKNPYSEAEKGKGIQAARFLADRKIDMVGSRRKMQFSGPGYVLSDAGIEVLEISGDTADEAVAELFSKTRSSSDGRA